MRAHETATTKIVGRFYASAIMKSTVVVETLSDATGVKVYLFSQSEALIDHKSLLRPM